MRFKGTLLSYSSCQYQPPARPPLQVTVGLFILMAAVSTPRAWNALSLADSALTPTYAIVTFAVVLQPNLGG